MSLWPRPRLLLVLSIGLMTACFGGKGDDDDDDDDDDLNAEDVLNAEIILPNEGETLDNPALDASVEVSGGDAAAGGGLYEDSVNNVRIDFVAASGNIVGAGIRFGDNGPIRTVQIPDAEGVTEGTLSFDFQIPPEICDDLADICHDVRCYEFAVTDAGNISAENITDLAMACGNCDEPSCQSLLQECTTGDCLVDEDCDGGEVCVDGACVQTGDLRFTMRWSTENDVDLHVLTPGGSEIYYANSTADGGELDVDDTGGGTLVENVFFTDPAPGTYTFWAVNYDGGEASSVTIEVATPDGTQATESGSLAAESGDETTHWTYNYGG